jgi:60 kDa SS-A/Ro ribonucleoprotein
MTNYARHVTSHRQSEQAPGTVPNSAGGYAFPVDAWTRLDRFLILGSEGGTYYIGERKLTKENAKHLDALFQESERSARRAVERIVEISESGRAAKPEPALFALALATKWPHAKQLAYEALPKVARTGTHLFYFAEQVNAIRGWGRGLRRAVADWYLEKDPNRLAYLLVKYQQRNGWSHRDLLRLSHAKPDRAHKALFAYAVTHTKQGDTRVPDIINAVLDLNRMTDASQAAYLIATFDIPREAVPTQFLKDPLVWEALLQNMPITATIRNLATLTDVGLLRPLGSNVGMVCDRITNAERLKAGRVHPIALLAALKVYAAGHGVKGSKTWEPVKQVVDALDAAFVLAFDAVIPSGKRTLLALDVSGSMYGNKIAGLPFLDAREASVAMSLVTARVEPNYHLCAFSTTMVPLNYTGRSTLNDALRVTNGMPFGGTDCAMPMLYAIQNKLDVDQFVIYTDSETWAGGIHPFEALQRYRRYRQIPAKMVVVGMTSTGFTIADPTDGGMLDVVGFDTTTPNVISDF